MANEYSSEKMVKMHEEIVQLKVTVKSQRTCIRIHKFLAIAGWLAFIAALLFGGA